MPQQYVIVQHNKAVEFIDEEFNKNITNGQIQGARGIVRKNGTFLPFGSIADILTLDQYYQKFPDARPSLERSKEQIIKDREYYKPIEFTASRRQEKFKGILKGLKKFIDEEIAKGIKPLKAMGVYKEKLDKYKELFGKKDSRSELEKIAEDFGGEVVPSV